jgi:hypothetical protein
MRKLFEEHLFIPGSSGPEFTYFDSVLGEVAGAASYLRMASSSRAAKPVQLFSNLLALFPRGHHWTLPEPRKSVPNRSSPLLTSISSELLLPRLVNSTFETWLTVTLVWVRFLAISCLSPTRRIVALQR